MPKVYIPIERSTRGKLYAAKLGDTWDVLLDKMLRAYNRVERDKRRSKARNVRETSCGQKPKA